MKLNKMIIIFIIGIMLINIFCNIVNADIDSVIDTSREVSLSITKYENSNGSKENKGFAGVEFTIYLFQ